MTPEKDDGKDLTEYVKLSVDELETLQKSYNDKIDYKEKNHWVNKAQEKVKFDIRKLLKRSLFIIMGLFLLSALLMVVLSIFSKDKLAENFILGFAPMMILMLPLAVIMTLLEDGTRELYRERNKIALILKNKQKPKKSEMPNPRAVFILTLLAKYPDGLNRADIKKLAQREFSKSLDNKTIDEYLRQLSSSMTITEKAYKSPTGGNDMKNTKVYALKL